MPFYDELLEKYPHTLIEASGDVRRLARGRDGQLRRRPSLTWARAASCATDIARINHEIATGEFFTQPRPDARDG